MYTMISYPDRVVTQMIRPIVIIKACTNKNTIKGITLNDMDTGIDTDIDAYRLARKLDGQGPNRTYLAHPRNEPTQSVVIKIYTMQRLRLHPSNERTDFLQAAQALTRLTHPSLLPLYEVGVKDGWPYVIMHYAPAGSLRQRLQQADPLPVADVQSIIDQVGQALTYLHEQQIVHGNVTPEHILFTEQQQAQLAGIHPLRFTGRLGMKRGHPSAYLAPEQLAEQESFQSDQYALGCVAFEMLTGTSPVMRGFSDAIPAHMRPRLTPQIEQVLQRAMANAPQDRYPDVAQFCQAFHEAIAQTLLPPSIPDDTASWDDTAPTQIIAEREADGEPVYVGTMPNSAANAGTPRTRRNNTLRIWLSIAII
ncbi:MAG TPA: serine/threonine-protein kinase, partial [Ktedonobacteraceae bacterium]|nr:serine/threonine-protein kinase [Ktedonobacteraceae bacterium]